MNTFILLSSGPSYREYYRRLSYLPNHEVLNMRVHITELDTDQPKAAIHIYRTNRDGSTSLSTIDCSEETALDLLNEYGVKET